MKQDQQLMRNGRSLSMVMPELYVYLHVVQQRPDSYDCSVSGQVSLRHTTPLQFPGALAFMPMPPVRPFVQDLSSGDWISSDQQSLQQRPLSAAVLTLNGGVHVKEGAHLTLPHGSWCPRIRAAEVAPTTQATITTRI